MIVRDLVRRLGAGRRVLDATGAELAWSEDLDVVRTTTPAEAGAEDVLVLAADPARPADEADLPADLPVGTTVVLLVPAVVAQLPVPWLVEALATMRLQATEVVPGTARAYPVAVVARRTDEPVALAPYLRPDDSPGVPTSADLTTLLSLVVLESTTWRAVEAEGLRRHAADVEALGEARAEVERLTAEVERLRTRLDPVHVLEQDLARTRAALDQVRSSTSFQVVRRLASVGRVVDPRRRGGAATR